MSRRRTLSQSVAVAAVLTVLVTANLLNNTLAVPAYVATSLVAVGLLLLIHRGADGTSDDAGLRRAALPRGARWALLLVATVALCYLVGALLPATHTLFLDARIEPGGTAAIAFQVFIRIPLGTVLLEEIGFRGVLYGLIRRTHGVALATTTSSALVRAVARAACIAPHRRQPHAHPRRPHRSCRSGGPHRVRR